ncbi:MAG: hypothetical protein QXL86_01300 [Candidatus Aenigmatarchaeota archaeon]
MVFEEEIKNYVQLSNLLQQAERAMRLGNLENGVKVLQQVEKALYEDNVSLLGEDEKKIIRRLQQYKGVPKLATQVKRLILTLRSRYGDDKEVEELESLYINLYNILTPEAEKYSEPSQ